MPMFLLKYNASYVGYNFILFTDRVGMGWGTELASRPPNLKPIYAPVISVVRQLLPSQMGEKWKSHI